MQLVLILALKCIFADVNGFCLCLFPREEASVFLLVKGNFKIRHRGIYTPQGGTEKSAL
jgi:hypothetical protein